MTGFDVENIVRTGIRLNKLSLANEKLLIKPKEMSRFEDHELIILETGRMGEPINGLRKMSIGRHRYVEIKDGDLVYIVTTPSIAKEAVNGTCRKHGLPSRWHCQIDHVKLARVWSRKRTGLAVDDQPSSS